MEGQDKLKDVKEVIDAGFYLAKVAKDRFSDGVQAGDFISIAKKAIFDSEFKKVMEQAVDGLPTIPFQAMDFRFGEVKELISYVKAKVVEFKK